MPLEDVTAKWEIDSLLLTEFEFQQMAAQIDPARWALVHWDDFSALFLRRLPAHAVAIDRTELKHLPPFGGMEGLQQRAQDPEWVTGARRELNQILSVEPDCQRALYFHGLISLYAGDLERAERELLRARSLGSNPFIDSALQRVLESASRPGAKATD